MIMTVLTFFYFALNRVFSLNFIFLLLNIHNNCINSIYIYNKKIHRSLQKIFRGMNIKSISSYYLTNVLSMIFLFHDIYRLWKWFSKTYSSQRNSSTFLWVHIVGKDCSHHYKNLLQVNANCSQRNGKYSQKTPRSYYK